MADDRLFFEDVEVGEFRELGSFTVSTDDIVSFAREYDPQPYHVDPDAAEASPFGGLIASGWHTLCLSTRLAVEGFRGRAATMGGLGIDNLRWTHPVRPGDRIDVYDEVVEKRVSESDPSRGIVRERITACNQDDEQVLVYEVVGLFRRASEGESARVDD